MPASNQLLIHALSMAGGAAVGAFADKDDRGQGAIIGAGIGLLGASVPRLHANWKGPAGKAFRAIPGKGKIGLGAATIGAFGYGMMSRPAEFERAGVAKTSPTGSVEESDVTYDNYKYSLSDRVASMNAGGDLVFGLHNLRHG
jgi:hypothetical protein